ncbi:MAG: hypothetical protein IT453_10225 [Planctomycetes bacterium]|nr:hypothetical protein [Planctomycetota bacterium]
MQGWRWHEEKPEKPRRGRWSSHEVQLLKDWYGLRDNAAIARDLHRTPDAVQKMADVVFRSAKRTGPWSAQEVQDLKKYLGASNDEVIAQVLGRDVEEIRQQITELGRLQHNGRWTRDETNEFRRLYGTRSDEDLALIFGRTVDSVHRLAQRYCLAKDKAYVKKLAGRGATRMPRWSDQELDILRRLYPNTPNLEIAQRLNRSVKSVVSKAHHLDLKKDVERLREMGRENVALRYRSE